MTSNDSPDRSDPDRPDRPARPLEERIDGFERQLAHVTELVARLGSGLLLVKCVTLLLLILVIAGVVVLAVFPDLVPGRNADQANSLLRDRGPNLQQDIYEAKRDLNQDLLDAKKELKQDVAEAKKQAREDSNALRKKLVDLQTQQTDIKNLLILRKLNETPADGDKKPKTK